MDKFIYLADFIVLDIEEDKHMSLIFGQPFLATARALIDVQLGKLTLHMDEEQIMFKVFDFMKDTAKIYSCFRVDHVNNEEIKEP